MASIYKEFLVDAPAQFAWEAIKDAGAVHSRLAQGFVTDTKLAGNTRTVTYADGFVVQEQVVSVDEEMRRFVYRSIGGRASHHNASFQVFPVSDGKSRVLWVTDLLPEEVRAPIEQMVEKGIRAIQGTLERSYRTAR